LCEINGLCKKQMNYDAKCFSPRQAMKKHCLQTVLLDICRVVIVWIDAL